MSVQTEPDELGFQGNVDRKFSWAKYLQHRPTYPTSFWSDLYDHHKNARPDNQFNVAHDVGAGAGVMSEILAERFEKVIVSVSEVLFSGSISKMVL